MNAPISTLAVQARTEVDTRLAAIVDRARQVTRKAADWLTSAKRPVHMAADKGLKLNTITHASIGKLVRQQVKLIDRGVDSGAKRLKVASKAGSFKDLVDDQIALLPETRKLLVDGARGTLGVAVETRSALTGLWNETVTDLRTLQKPPARRKPAKKKAATRKTAAKGKRPAAKKKPAAKKPSGTTRAAAKKPAATKRATMTRVATPSENVSRKVA